MTLSEIITAAITEAGGDGLCNVILGCECSLGDLAPCGSMIIGECEIAENSRLGGEDWFEPLRKEGEE